MPFSQRENDYSTMKVKFFSKAYIYKKKKNKTKQATMLPSISTSKAGTMQMPLKQAWVVHQNKGKNIILCNSNVYNFIKNGKIEVFNAFPNQNNSIII